MYWFGSSAAGSGDEVADRPFVRGRTRDERCLAANSALDNRRVVLGSRLCKLGFNMPAHVIPNPPGVACSHAAAAPTRRVQRPTNHRPSPSVSRLACRPQRPRRRSGAPGAQTLEQGPREIDQHGADRRSDGETHLTANFRRIRRTGSGYQEHLWRKLQGAHETGAIPNGACTNQANQRCGILSRNLSSLGGPSHDRGWPPNGANPMLPSVQGEARPTLYRSSLRRRDAP